MTLTYFSRSWGSISTWKFAIFACKHDNSTNFSHIGLKLIPWMCFLRSVLVKFEDGWPWPIFRGHGGRFQHENLQFSLVNTIAQQILVALGPNLYHGCVLRVSWLSLQMGDIERTQISRSWGSISMWKFAIFSCKHDDSTNISRIGPKLIPWMYPSVTNWGVSVSGANITQQWTNTIREGIIWFNQFLLGGCPQLHTTGYYRWLHTHFS